MEAEETSLNSPTMATADDTVNAALSSSKEGTSVPHYGTKQNVSGCNWRGLTYYSPRCIKFPILETLGVFSVIIIVYVFISTVIQLAG